MPVTKWGDRYATATATASAHIDTSDFFRKSGDTLEGDLNTDRHRIINLPVPTADDDAVNLRYASENFLRAKEGVISNEIVTKAMVTIENGLDVESTLNMNNHPITNVLTPEQNNDAVNKAYVDEVRAQLDSSIGTASQSTLNEARAKLALTGGTITGPLTLQGTVSMEGAINVSGIATLENILDMQAPIDMNRRKIVNLATPTYNTDAATKAYADTKLPANGGVMEGELDLDDNKIINLAGPVDASDAATKAYVDALAARVALLEGMLSVGRT